MHLARMSVPLQQAGSLCSPVLRRHDIVIADDVVDFHDVDPISKAARVATTKHR